MTIVVPGPPETVDIEQGMSQAEKCSPQGERLEVPSYMSAQGCNLKPYCASLSHPFSVVASLELGAIRCGGENQGDRNEYM